MVTKTYIEHIVARHNSIGAAIHAGPERRQIRVLQVLLTDRRVEPKPRETVGFLKRIRGEVLTDRGHLHDARRVVSPKTRHPRMR